MGDMVVDDRESYEDLIVDLVRRMTKEERREYYRKHIDPIRGIRTAESRPFIEYFLLIQEEAGKKEAVFFLDTEEGHVLPHPTMEVENLSGWLVPFEKADEFENIWWDNKENDDWVEYYCFAIPYYWGNELKIKFEI